ncbi:MAG: CMP-binding protein, partial [Pirellulaceae bacterium]
HGSPRIPMTLEAIALHFIDDLDAKLNMSSEWIRADRNSDSPWTAFHPMLGRKLYKPSLEE